MRCLFVNLAEIVSKKLQKGCNIVTAWYNNHMLIVTICNQRKEFMKQKVLGIFNAVKQAPHFVKVIAYFVISAVVAVTCLAASGVTVAYSVSYSGSNIGQISSPADFTKAQTLAANAIMFDNGASYIKTPRFNVTLALKKNLTTTGDLANGILTNTAEIAKSTALIVNGNRVAVMQNGAELEALINKRLSAYNIKGLECSAEFADNVLTEDVFYTVKNLNSKEEVEAILLSLAVKTHAKIKRDVAVPYATVTVQSSSKLIGYYSVTQKGQKGLKQKVEQVNYLNGKETGRQTLNDVLVRAAVNEKITIGTATSKKAASSVSASSGLAFPINKSVHYSYSTLFRGNRGRHKGVDIVCAKGTAIYSVLGGTVEEAGYRSDYGNYIIVNHGNGMRTRYAHCSKLYVKRGSKVVKGQTIALVGNTGRSYGAHLHFEIMVNGNLVNPLNYIK